MIILQSFTSHLFESQLHFCRSKRHLLSRQLHVSRFYHTYSVTDFTNSNQFYTYSELLARPLIRTTHSPLSYTHLPQRTTPMAFIATPAVNTITPNTRKAAPVPLHSDVTNFHSSMNYLRRKELIHFWKIFAIKLKTKQALSKI